MGVNLCLQRMLVATQSGVHLHNPELDSSSFSRRYGGHGFQVAEWAAECVLCRPQQGLRLFCFFTFLLVLAL